MTISIQQQELKTLEQRSREVCLSCAGLGKLSDDHAINGGCEHCQGTGCKWPGFSRECESFHSMRAGDSLEKANARLTCCQGSGRVPVSVAEAVLWGMEWVKKRRCGIQLACFRAEHGWHCIIYGARDGVDRWDGKGETSALALFAAMKEVE